MTRHLRFRAGEKEAGERLDSVAAARSGTLSRSLFQQLIQDGKVLVNGRSTKPAYRLAPGDLIEARLDVPPSLTAAPEDLPVSVVYRDDEVAVIDKPAGMVVHPAGGHRTGTLANALTSMFPGARGVGPAERPGIVHRLDKDTSGLIAIALTPHAQRSLQQQMALRLAGRVYLALCAGHPIPTSGIIDAPVGRDRLNRRRMAAYGSASRPARTSYRVLEELTGFALVEASLQTGRTHQIRVHFAASGHPLAGDGLYGGPSLPGLHRQFLHAHQLAFDSPTTNDRLIFHSALPADLERVLSSLRSTSASSGGKLITRKSPHP